METDLFEWSAWDLVCDTILQFYGCTLKVSIGDFNIGDMIPIIFVDFENGTLQLLDKGKVDGEKTLLSEHRVKMVLAD